MTSDGDLSTQDAPWGCPGPSRWVRVADRLFEGEKAVLQVMGWVGHPRRRGNRGTLVADADPAAVESAIAAGLEARKERWHRRSERNPRLAKDAKRYHGLTCMVCGFNFIDRYGEVGDGFIEAHHLTPFSELDGRPTHLDPRTDFIVACPNCHRMLHRRTPPLAPAELELLLR